MSEFPGWKVVLQKRIYTIVISESEKSPLEFSSYVAAKSDGRLELILILLCYSQTQLVSFCCNLFTFILLQLEHTYATQISIPTLFCTTLN